MTRPRPFRFGTTAGPSADPGELLEWARTAEQLGYSTFGVADHFQRPFAPLIALQAVADATSTIRLSQAVLAQDFRHPAVLAKELATLDVLSGGRVQVGIGAGWMRQEYEQAGIPFAPAPTRIDRLAEVAIILKGLFGDAPFSFAGDHFTITDLDGLPKPVQQPRPPIMIGGAGRRVLSVAARHADIVHVLPSSNPKGAVSIDPRQMTADAVKRKVGWIEDAAGDRFDDLELALHLLAATITDRPLVALDALARRIRAIVRQFGGTVDVHEDDLRASPFVAIGSVDAVCEKLGETRERYGISYFLAPHECRPEVLASVIDRLGGVSRYQAKGLCPWPATRP